MLERRELMIYICVCEAVVYITERFACNNFVSISFKMN